MKVFYISRFQFEKKLVIKLILIKGNVLMKFNCFQNLSKTKNSAKVSRDYYIYILKHKLQQVLAQYFIMYNICE